MLAGVGVHDLVGIGSAEDSTLVVGILEKVELAVAHLLFLVLLCYKFILAFGQLILILGALGAELRGG